MLTEERTPRRVPRRGALRRVEPPVAGRLRAVAPDGRPEVRARPFARPGRWSRRSTKRRTATRECGAISRWPSAGSIRRCRKRRSTSSRKRWTSRAPRGRPTSCRGSTGGPTSTSTKPGSARSGRSGRRATRRSSPRLAPLYDSEDAGIRKMVVYALGALPGEAQLPTLPTALKDEAADVRWNAAVALARHDSARGRAGAAADARSRVRRADGQARRPASTKIRIRLRT